MFIQGLMSSVRMSPIQDVCICDRLPLFADPSGLTSVEFALI